MFSSLWKKKDPVKDQQIKEKEERLKNARQDEKYKLPNPRGDAKYPEEDVLDFEVVFETYKKLKLKTYRYPQQNVEKAKAIVCILHGLDQHSNRGAHIAKAFAEKGFVVLAYDYRGHGKSEGTRGLILDSYQLITDTFKFIRLIQDKEEYAKLPIFLIGHSVGGQVCFQVAQMEPERFKGVILMAPLLMTNVNSFVQDVSSILGSILPQQKGMAQFDKGADSKNPLITQDFFNDEYTIKEAPLPQTMKSAFGAMAEAKKAFRHFHSSYLMIQGGSDKFVDPDVASELDRKSPSQDKSLIYLEDMWHDIWHEQEILEIIPQMVDWVNNRV